MAVDPSPESIKPLIQSSKLFIVYIIYIPFLPLPGAPPGPPSQGGILYAQCSGPAGGKVKSLTSTENYVYLILFQENLHTWLTVIVFLFYC